MAGIATTSQDSTRINPLGLFSALEVGSCIGILGLACVI